MLKRPFVLFIFSVSVMVGATVGFIQSRTFANMIKGTLTKYVPSEIGVHGDFSEFAIKLFPPGLSIRNPRVTLSPKNVFNMPADSVIRAERIDLNFLPFQMLSGNIRVNEVVIAKGDVQLALDPAALKKKKNEPKKKYQWDELLRVRAESIALEDSRIRFGWNGNPYPFSTDFLARSLKFSRGSTGSSYEFIIELGDAEIHSAASGTRRFQGVTAKAKLDPSGIEIENIAVQIQGVTFLASGAIRGDILDPKTLMTEAQVSVQGQLAKFLPKLDPKLFQGEVSFTGKIKGDLQRVSETFRADGTLTGTAIQARGWAADRVTVEGSWVPSEIVVTKAVISAEERPKKGAFQPGYGGLMEVGAFRYRLGSADPIALPLRFERAHANWLGLGALKQVYPLDFRVNGPLNVQLQLPQGKLGWSVKAKSDLTLTDFLVDNQKYQAQRPYKTVVRTKNLLLSGDFGIDASGFKAGTLSLAMERSKFQITGKVDAKTGYDLIARGPVNLEDVTELGGIKIQGTGLLSAHLNGPFERMFVDFDTDLDNAYYVNLLLGKVKGRITLDEDPSVLLFKNVRGAQGLTDYRVDGKIDLNESTIALDALIENGRTQDLLKLFSDLTQEISWLPSTLTGSTSAKIHVGGGLGTADMVVRSEVTGTDWSYLGEKFKTVSLVGGYDRGKYSIQGLKALKRTGFVTGEVSYDKDRRIEWKLATEGFTISDLDTVTRLDVPIRGRLNIGSGGHGKVGEIESTTVASLSDFVVRGLTMPNSDLSLKSSDGVTRFNGNALGGQGILELAYDFRNKSASFVRTELRRLDFSPILLLLNPKAIQDPALAGHVSGNVDLTFRTGEMDKASGKMQLSEYLLAKTGVRFSLVKPVSIKIDRGTFTLDDLAVRGNLGEASLTLKGHDSNLDGTVKGEVDVALLEFLTPVISQGSGTAKLDVSIRGTLASPEIDGKADLGGALVRTPSLESPFENITGTVQLKQNKLTVKNLQAELAQGRLNAGGTVELFGDRFPLLNLNASLTDNKLKIYPFQYLKLKSGEIKVTGETLPYSIEGAVVVDSALSREKLSSAGGDALKSTLYSPPATARREGDLPKFRLNIDVTADNQVYFQNEFFDVEMKTHVKLVNTLEAPRILGKAEVITASGQSRLHFKDHSFLIQSGNIVFDNPAVINPVFDMGALTEVNGIKIQLYASGKKDKYKVELSSNPVMPESEILSLLALGFTSEDAKRLRTGNLGAVQQGEAASLILHSLDFNRDVKNKTGFQIQVDEAVDKQIGSSIFRPQSDADSTAAPKIVLKRKIGKRVDLSLGSTVGAGNTNQREVNAEFHVTPNFSLQGVWNDQEDAGSPEKRKSFGLDLKLQKRFR